MIPCRPQGTIGMESYEAKLQRTICEAKSKSDQIKTSKRRVIVIELNQAKKWSKGKGK